VAHVRNELRIRLRSSTNDSRGLPRTTRHAASISTTRAHVKTAAVRPA
jgi:hypothetical protein